MTSPLVESKLVEILAESGITEEKVDVSEPFVEGQMLEFDEAAGAWKAGIAPGSLTTHSHRVVYFGYASDRPDVVELKQCKLIKTPCTIKVSRDLIDTTNPPVVGRNISVTAAGKYRDAQTGVTPPDVVVGRCIGIHGNFYILDLD